MPKLFDNEYQFHFFTIFGDYSALGFKSSTFNF